MRRSFAALAVGKGDDAPLARGAECSARRARDDGTPDLPAAEASRRAGDAAGTVARWSPPSDGTAGVVGRPVR